MICIKRFLMTAILSVSLIISGCTSIFEQQTKIEKQASKTNQSHAENKSDTSNSDLQVQSKEALLLTKANRFRSSLVNMQGVMLNEFKQAVLNVKQQKYSQALSRLAPYLNDANKHSAVWVLRGDIASAQKQQTSEIIGFYQQAIAVNTDNYLAHNRLAIILSRQGKFEQALGHYEKALDSWPAFATGYLNRGILLDLYMGKKQQALEDYQTYQGLISLTQGKPNKKVRGWIVDLERQLKRERQEKG
ncbi:tetratricopeptide repeat protein [Paraglaciecola sp.]|uniref:tetratricopeptide repeat protein n=1 Tax=Paraglaciecola sp. TaxID=1920173 RepID=UPI003EF5000A